MEADISILEDYSRERQTSHGNVNYCKISRGQFGYTQGEALLDKLSLKNDIGTC